MYKHLKWAYRLALTAAFVSVGGRVAAQTPEGTVITNTATATYTDANTNSYAAVSGSVNVTVGFLPGVAVTANAPPSDMCRLTVGRCTAGIEKVTNTGCICAMVMSSMVFAVTRLPALTVLLPVRPSIVARIVV